MTSKVWFITGSSRGFGKEWAVAALDRGDRVAATARNTDDVQDLVDRFGDAVLPVELDVTDKAAVEGAVRQTVDTFGRIDVAVNNAGYGQFGMVEELSEQELRAQIETNVFGAIWVTQAVLPTMREQRSGRILQVSSIGGISAFPGIGAYHASKWALEGISQALSQEVAEFGITVTLIEPGGFSTDWAGPSAKHADPIEAYDPVREAQQQRRGGQSAGDPEATRGPILEIVDAEEPPLRVFLGASPLGIAKADYAKRIETWEAWQPVSERAQG